MTNGLVDLKGLSEREIQEYRDSLNKKEILTQSEAAFLFGTTRQTLFRMRNAGLPFYRMNSQVKYRRSELEAFLRRDNQEQK